MANLLSILALIATAIYLITPQWITWASLPFPLWLRWSGVELALIGFGLLQWAHHALGKNWSDTPRLLPNQTLTTSGPYQWIRHPIYTAFLLIMGAILFISANWFIGISWIVGTFREVISRVRFEEKILIGRFGNQYRDYMEKTGLLIPRLNS